VIVGNGNEGGVVMNLVGWSKSERMVSKARETLVGQCHFEYA